MVRQTLYNLADEQVEYQIRDRLSFMRFLGLGLEDTVPDATTVWLFREALAKAGLVKTLFDRFNHHLDAKGYIARGGQIENAQKDKDVASGQIQERGMRNVTRKPFIVTQRV